MEKLLDNGKLFATSFDYDKLIKSFNAHVKWYHLDNKYLGTQIPEKYLNYQLTSEQLYNYENNKSNSI